MAKYLDEAGLSALVNNIKALDAKQPNVEANGAAVNDTKIVIGNDAETGEINTVKFVADGKEAELLNVSDMEAITNDEIDALFA